MTLEARILDAHRRGATRELERLRAEYRRTREFTSWERGIVGTARLAPSAQAARPISRSSRSRAPVEVMLTARALEQIRHNAFWLTGMDGLETGGAVFGINAGEEVAVTRASVIGPRATRGSDFLYMDTGVLQSWELDDGISRIGGWHTHPNTVFGEPSDADIRSWRASFERVNKERFEPSFIGLILTGERGWSRPTIHAWTVDKCGECERAQVVTPPNPRGARCHD